MQKIMMLLFLLPISIATANDIYPNDIQTFIDERDICDHFRGEPFEGNSKEQKERRDFIFEQLKKYCPGTDAKLAVLKKKYTSDQSILQKLNQYEEKIEPTDKN